MKLCNNFKELESEIYVRIDKAMSEDVAPIIKETISKHVESDVYDVYEPAKYKRRGISGGSGIMDKGLGDIDAMYDEYSNAEHTLSVQDWAWGNSNYTPYDNGFIANIIETGEGYHYDFVYNHKPRPFMHNTYEELLQTGKHIQKLKQGLKRQGLNVK